MAVIRDVYGTNTSTSVYLVYKALKESPHTVLDDFDIGFPSEGCLATSSDSIFVRELGRKLYKKTSSGDIYKSRMEIRVITQKLGYLEVNKLLRTTENVIREVVSDDNNLKRRYVKFLSVDNLHGSGFELKAYSIVLECLEMTHYEVSDKEIAEYNLLPMKPGPTIK